jgi:transcriptional regulator with XRE-family HTH domain
MARINTDKALAGRLRKLRAAIFAENSTQFAKRIGVSIQRLNNFKNGFPLSIDVAKRIRAAVPGLTFDWLYHGDERALPVGMLDKLRAGSDRTKGKHDRSEFNVSISINPDPARGRSHCGADVERRVNHPRSFAIA